MLDSVSQAVSELVAHAHFQPEQLHELTLRISRTLNGQAGATVAVKQLALLAVLEELAKSYPEEHQIRNAMALTATLTTGVRLLIAVSAPTLLGTIDEPKPVGDDA